MLAWTIENTVLALGVTALAALVSRFCRGRPAVCHALWLLVIARLIVPPVPVLSFGSVDGPVTAALAMVRGEASSVAEDCRSGASPWAAPESKRPSESSRETEAAPPTAAEGEPGGPDASLAVTEHDSAAAPPSVATSRSATDGAGWARPAEAADPGTWLLIAWGLGSIFALATNTLRVVRFTRRIRRGGPAPAHLVKVVAEVARRMGASPPAVRVVDDLSSPLVWALGRPVLLWPTHARLLEDRHRIRAVIAHELAHLQRRDHLTVWVEVVGAVLLWWNPLFWLARRQLRRYAELACDAWVVHVFPHRRRDYAEALLDVAAAETTAFASVGLGDANRCSLERRLSLIMRENATPRLSVRGFAALLLVGVALLAVPGGAQEGERGSVDQAVDVAPALEKSMLRLRARRAFEARDWVGAAEVFEKLVGIDPDDAKSWSHLGTSSLRSGDCNAAVVAFEKQAKLGHQVALARYNVACATARLGAEKKALKLLDRAVKFGFTDGRLMEKDIDLGSIHDLPAFAKVVEMAREAGAVREKADLAFELSKYDVAAAGYRKLAEMCPEDGSAAHRLAYCLIGARRLSEAEVACLRQVELGYAVATAFYNLACVKSLEGDADAAFAYLAKSHEAGFNDARYILEDTDLDAIRNDARFAAYADQARVAVDTWKEAESALERDEFAAAVKAGRRVVELWPDSSRAQSLLGRALLGQGDSKSAIPRIERAIALGSKPGPELLALARAHVASGDARAAMEAVKAAIALGFHDEKELASLLSPLGDAVPLTALRRALIDARFLQDLGASDWDQLAARADRWLERNPESGEALSYLGLARAGSGRYDDAILVFARQAELGYQPDLASYNTACCYALGGKVDAAFGALDRAVKAGFKSADHAREDADLDALRDDPRFEKFLKSMESCEGGAKTAVIRH